MQKKKSYEGEFASITTTIWNFLQCTNLKKNSCCDNYLRKYGISKCEFYIPIVCFKWHFILIFLNVEISSKKLKMYYLSKKNLTLYCLKKNILAFSLKLSKVFLHLYSRSEQFWNKIQFLFAQSRYFFPQTIHFSETLLLISMLELKKKTKVTKIYQS